MPASTFGKFVNPKSIAVVGASRSPAKVGYQILHNLIHDGYSGRLYPVNPNAAAILGLKCYPAIHALPKSVDLAIIVTPAALVSTLLAECAEQKVSHAIIISAGFAEAGPKGKELQEHVRRTILDHHLHVLGPNCLGVLSPVHQVNASFGPRLPDRGGIMLISQSGALVTGIIDWANLMDIGLSHAVTFGNRLGIGEIEALQFAADDPHTKAILVYLESFENAPEFFKLCSRITPRKPVIFLKGGQSPAGQAASASHTAALASSYVLTQAFARQSGVVICDTIQEWLSIAAAFTHVRPATGTDLTIVTNAGGPGVLSTDEATGLGLDVPELSSGTKLRLQQVLPRLNPHNPLDILGDATPPDFKTALNVIKTDRAVQNLITIITPQTTTKPLESAQAIIDSGVHKILPTYVVLIGGDKMEHARELLSRHRILNFDFPTVPIRCIAAKAGHEAACRKITAFPAKKHSYIPAKTRDKLDRHLRDTLTLHHAFEVLAAYGFVLPKSAIVSALAEVGEALAFVGQPAVAKTAGMNIVHKAQVGGVVLNLMTATQARLAFRKLKRLAPEVIFQQTVKGELELIIGAKRDPQFGPFVTFGLGGTLTNTLKDRAYVFIPASTTYLSTAFAGTKAAAAMRQKHLPVEMVVDAAQRLAAILLDFDCIEELEINPAIITSKHLYAADIKITLKEQK